MSDRPPKGKAAIRNLPGRLIPNRGRLTANIHSVNHVQNSKAVILPGVRNLNGSDMTAVPAITSAARRALSRAMTMIFGSLTRRRAKAKDAAPARPVPNLPPPAAITIAQALLPPIRTGGRHMTGARVPFRRRGLPFRRRDPRRPRTPRRSASWMGRTQAGIKLLYTI